ncbi:hypothetical protein DMC47_39435 [Nostoc sp. 3335mG]|nr:hypothetical protein DMC47_39435 [Nostoc sp. 3335mG]
MTISVAEAREWAASVHDGAGHDDMARAIRSGGGDDFFEVKVALLARSAMLQQVTRYKIALGVYADDSFWDAEIPEASLAFHDGGEVARAALAGLDLQDLLRE